ncbi:MAG: excinuclease ABC subunit UvrA, partial [Clostridia bacterium]|nr:excinuclease ABC subunit UvrA [Clostridia bacterium]
IGIPHCPICGEPIKQQSVDEIVSQITELDEGTRFMVLAPVVSAKKGMHEKVFEDARKSGYVRVRVDGIMYDLSENFSLDKNIKHDIDIIVDRLVMRGDIRSRLAESIETASKLANGIIKILFPDASDDDNEMIFSQNYACKTHGVSIGELTPRMFSFNNPSGACEACGGLGENNVFSEEKLIPDRSLSIYAGAIVCNGFKSAEPGGYFAELINSVGRYHGFDVHTPIEKYSEEAFNILMYGNKRKRTSVSEPSFKGVIGMLDHRYKMGGGYETRDYYEQFMDFIPCPECHGKRLKNEALAVTVGGVNISDLCSMSVINARKFFATLKLTKTETEIAREILKEINERLSFLENVGLGYLTLSRKAGSLSGGEAQRIRLATQIGSSLVGVMYVLDEPSIGLHQRDNRKLINTLKKLRDIGNTVLVVEHDEETIEEADYIVDIGPGAGVHGGEVVFTGTPAQIKKCKHSITGQYLSGEKSVTVPTVRRKGNGGFITVVGARENNLKDIDVTIPLGKFVCVTGVSGSGKSSLVNAVLYNTLARKLGRASLIPGKHTEIVGIDNIDKIIQIDQSPIGRNPRSNPATYIGLFNDIRAVFASTPDAKARGYSEGRFSFNVKGGRCESCRGDGTLTIEMHFLPDVYVTCDVCKGKRYNHETLEIKYKGKSIYDILEMTCDEGREFFQNYPSIKRKLDTLCDVGLGYVKIGQPATTLSGGEAQRVKLANELSKRATGKTLYVLDEPTTGLHTDDVNKLVSVLQKLVDAGNSVVVIEHNLDLIKTADYIIDLGPEGGNGGGKIVAQGTP